MTLHLTGPANTPVKKTTTIRWERKPPYRLQIVEGDWVTEIPLKNLENTVVLRTLLGFVPFCSGQDVGGIYNGSDKNLVVWSEDV